LFDYDLALRTMSSNLHYVTPKDLTADLDNHRYMYREELPHIFETIWALKLQYFTESVNKYIGMGQSFWSSTCTTLWLPNAQVDKKALYSVTVNYINGNNKHFEVEKSFENSPGCLAFYLPISKSVNREYKPTNQEIQTVLDFGKFPREFFTHRSDWEEFNKFTQLLQIDDLLTG